MSTQQVFHLPIVRDVYKGCLIEIYNPSSQQANQTTYSALIACGGLLAARTVVPFGPEIPESVTFRNNIIMLLGDFATRMTKEDLMALIDHEVGHIVHNHLHEADKVTPMIVEEHEIEADNYALQFHSPEVLHGAVLKCIAYTNVNIHGMSQEDAVKQPVTDDVLKARLDRLEKMFA